MTPALKQDLANLDAIVNGYADRSPLSPSMRDTVARCRKLLEVHCEVEQSEPKSLAALAHETWTLTTDEAEFIANNRAPLLVPVKQLEPYVEVWPNGRGDL